MNNTKGWVQGDILVKQNVNHRRVKKSDQSMTKVEDHRNITITFEN